MHINDACEALGLRRNTVSRHIWSARRKAAAWPLLLPSGRQRRKRAKET